MRDSATLAGVRNGPKKGAPRVVFMSVAFLFTYSFLMLLCGLFVLCLFLHIRLAP